MHSVANANGIDTSKFYWETAEPAELNTLVERLSNTEDDERILIREIFTSEKAENCFGCSMWSSNRINRLY